MKKLGLIVLILIGAAGALWFFNSPDDDNSEHDDRRAAVSEADVRFESYVTSSACRKCHESQYDSWHATYHRTMTQRASARSVVGNFDDVKLSAYGRDYHFQRRGGEYLVTMVPPEWETDLLLSGRDPAAVPDPPVVTRPVVQTTGSHLMQTYWVEGEDGLRQVPWFFHIEERMWIPAEDSFLTPPDKGRVYSIWNMQCLKCHATGGQPRQNQFDGRFHSKVPELGIACEACHGSAADHVALHSGRSRSTDPGVRDPIFNPAKASHIASSQTCGQCHSSSVAKDLGDWMNTGSKFRPGQDFTQFAYYELPFDGDSTSDGGESEYPAQGYWQDGSCRVGGDEFLGLMKSPCYLEGSTSCLSCHSMHDSDPTDQLRRGMRTNEACLPCHENYRNQLSQHTHHAPESSGSLCYNCHMPHTSYALFKALRSHRIDSPSAAVSVKTGRPNACNLCHLDRTLEWTASTLADWYGHESPTITDEQKTVPAALLWLLKGNAMQRVIAAWSMSWKPAREAAGEQISPPFLAATLTDPYAAVRFVAWRSLKSYTGLEDTEFSFAADERDRESQRDAALKQVQMLNPKLSGLPDAGRLSVSDYESLLQEIDKLQGQRDEQPIHIPE